MSQDDDVLRAEFDLNFTYTRTTGAVIGRFFTELRDRKLIGIKGSDGSVICPPTEYDPKTAAELNEFVDLVPTGTVKTWSWVKQPREKHPLDKPFAWALIQIDGADTSMLHAVDCASENTMSAGMKVKIRWADETTGRINDIACFEPA